MHTTLITAAALAVCSVGLAAPHVAQASASISDAAAVDAGALPTTTPIKHLVVVFEENASFDHYFGTYPIAANPTAANPPGDPPFVARTGTLPVNNLLPSPLNGNRNLLTSNPNQSPPFRLDRAQFVTCSQDHSYRLEQRAANQGRMDRFVQQTDRSGCNDLPRSVPSPQVMGYFDGNTVTGLWNYAQHFALNDNAFGTTYGPSTPGALNLVAGRTSGASPDNATSVTEGVVYGDANPGHDVCSDPTKAQTTLSGPNVGDLLNQAGVSWGWFQGGFRLDPANDPALACEQTHPNLAGQQETDYEPHHEPFQYFASTANESHLPPSSDAAIGHDDQANHQYDLQDFWAAADEGNLPAVSFLKAAGYQDGHPGPANSNPLDEQDFLVNTLNRLQRLPEWLSTAVVLAWDDSDGQYDHQFPPNVHHSHNPALDTLYGVTTSTDPTTLMCMAPLRQSLPVTDPSVFEMRCGYGERIPLLVVSPYAKDNYVDHTLVDQTSILRFIEDNWGLGRLGSASFDNEAGLLLNMFDFGHRRDDRLFLNHFTGNPNTPPTIDDVALAPAAPLTDDVVSVTSDASDVDRDPTNAGRADAVATTYAWFNGDRQVAGNVNSLDLSQPGVGDRGDTITVRVTADDGLDTKVAEASVVVGNTAPVLDVDAPELSVDYSDPLGPVEVTPTDADHDPITVSATGLPAGVELTTAPDGLSTLGGVVDAPTGTYDVTLRASDGTASSEYPLRIVVRREGASVSYTGDLLFSTGSTTATTAPVQLRAHVTQDADGSPGDLTRAELLFDLYASTSTTGVPDATYAAAPDGAGDATVDLPALGSDTWTVVVRTDPDAGFFAAPNSEVVPVTVYTPSPGSFVTGGGWVHDPGYLDRPVPIAPDHDHGNLGVSVKPRKDGSPSGHATYTFRGADGLEYVIRSTSWQGGGLAVAGDHATVAGRCTVTVLDASGAVVSEAGGLKFRMDVVDGLATGGQGAFALAVYASDGTLYHRVGTPADPLPLAGGAIVVHR